MPTPRVLQVVLSLQPGGTERLVVELVRRLHGTIPMRVCCLDQRGAWAREVETVGVEVVPLGRQPGFHPGLGRGIAAAAAAHGATLIHAHHYSPFVYSCLARLRSPRLHVLYTEHGRVSDAPPSGKRRMANVVLRRFPSRVYAVSEDLKRHLAGEGFAAADVAVIYNGIDAGPAVSEADRSAVRADLQLDAGTLVVGTVARLDPVKDLKTLISAVAIAARQRPICALVIGDGPERAGLAQAAAALGVGHLVRFLGHRDDARRWLAGCDIYVNCSTSEGVSLTILEAMAAGLPVVATRVGGTPEILDEASGVLVPPRSAEALAAALMALSQDRARRTAAGIVARRRVLEAFSLDRMVRSYGDAYMENS